MMVSSEQLISVLDTQLTADTAVLVETPEQKAFEEGFLAGLKKARFETVKLVEPFSQNEKPFLLMNDKEKALLLMCDEELYKMVLEMDAESVESEEDLNLILLFKIYKKVKKVLKRGIKRVKETA